jgi:hypothetical protein
VIFYVQSLEPSLGRLLSCSFTVAGVKTKLFPTKMATRLRELELLSRLRGLLADARHGASRDEILALLTRQPYTGEEGWLRLLGQKFFRDKWICLSG